MGSVNNNGVNICFHQSFHTLHRVGSNAHTGSHPQTSFGVFGSQRFVFSFGNVFIGYQTYEFVVFVDNGKFFNFVLLEYLCRFLQVCTFGGGNQPLAGHNLFDLFVHPTFKTQVAVGDNTDQGVIIIHNGNASNFKLFHQIESILYGFVWLNRHGSINHPVFCSFYHFHLARLLRNGHILVNYTDTAFPGNGNSHGSLRHCIHGCGNNRRFQFDSFGKTGSQIHIARQNFRISRY